MTRRAFLPAAIAFIILYHTTLTTAPATDAPVILRGNRSDEASLRLPDGTWRKLYVTRDGYGAAVTSTDGGQTWSEPEKPVKNWASKVFLDRDGQMHGFFIRMREGATGRRIAVDRFLDVWHFRTSGPGKQWEKARVVQEGWNGSIVDNAVQLPGGRIVQPSQDWEPGSRPEPPTGNGYALMLYSDDGGGTWQRSNKITAPVYPDYNGANFGACEPTITLREDGTLWSLMRTQTGFLYESSSADGAEWAPGKPSVLHSSTGPAALLKMPDKRLLVFWNNCEMPARVDGKGVYAGRDVLHAAVSDDDGRTWRGLREVTLDPRRNLTPPRKGDRGVAYPYAYLSDDGRRAEVVVGHGRGRSVLQVDPDWLLEKKRSDDFSHGLEGWCIFKPFGPVERWWRDRVPGPELMDDPDHPGAKALHLRKPDEKDADGAVWNFPAGHAGTLRFRLKLGENHGGATMCLADRFFEPTDPAVTGKAIYTLSITPESTLGDTSFRFPVVRWVNVELTWNDKECEVTVDGKKAGTLPQRHPAANGVSYVHLRSTATEPGMGGFLIGPVEAEVR